MTDTIERKAGFLAQLRERVSAPERAALESGDGLVISRYNRATMLRMLSCDEPEDGSVDTGSAEELERSLRAYLDRYMPDQPEGHKWIILSCLFLAFIAGEPMHPREVARWAHRGGEYTCTAREDVEGSLCRWCVCRGPASSP